MSRVLVAFGEIDTPHGGPTARFAIYDRLVLSDQLVAEIETRLRAEIATERRYELTENEKTCVVAGCGEPTVMRLHFCERGAHVASDRVAALEADVEELTVQRDRLQRELEQLKRGSSIPAQNKGGERSLEEQRLGRFLSLAELHKEYTREEVCELAAGELLAQNLIDWKRLASLLKAHKRIRVHGKTKARRWTVRPVQAISMKDVQEAQARNAAERAKRNAERDALRGKAGKHPAVTAWESLREKRPGMWLGKDEAESLLVEAGWHHGLDAALIVANDKDSRLPWVEEKNRRVRVRADGRTA